MQKNNAVYRVWDTCTGTVEGKSRDGVYLTLDNGEEAFAFRYTGLKIGDKVFCSVKHPARDGRKMLVTIDSTLQYDEVA